jgi:hypothetical protein
LDLIAAQVLACGCCGRSAEECGEEFDVTHIIVLGLVAELTDGHVLDHALPQRPDGLMGHRGSCLELEVVDPPILKTGCLPKLVI